MNRPSDRYVKVGEINARGHAPMLEHAEAFNRLLVGFLNG
jgi:pimeloyl-ACP methyl ester carboxylesterase